MKECQIWALPIDELLPVLDPLPVEAGPAAVLGAEELLQRHRPLLLLLLLVLLLRDRLPVVVVAATLACGGGVHRVALDGSMAVNMRGRRCLKNSCPQKGSSVWIQSKSVAAYPQF